MAYPSTVVPKHTRRNSITSADSGEAPVIIRRTRPPRRALSAPKIGRVQKGGARPSRSAARPAPKASLKSARFTADSLSWFWILSWILFQSLGTLLKSVGRSSWMSSSSESTSPL